MKKITTTLALCLLAGAAYAGPVSRDQAMRIAQSHFQTERNVRSAGQSPAALTLAYEYSPKATRSESSSTHPLYYVFNKGKSQGYVIVAGDDRISTVLGYTDNGQFNINNVNPAMRWWLDAVAAKVAQVQESKSTCIRPKKAAADVKSTVAPLIQTRWGRLNPYNILSPDDNVHPSDTPPSWSSMDVALAQIVNYWHGELTPTGKVDYVNADRVHVQADLDTFNIEWNELRNECHEYPLCSDEEAAKVSKLIYACSLANETNLCNYGSTNYYIYVKKLEERFKIDANCDSYPRYYYSDSEWEQLIKKELSEGRPVLYRGSSYENIESFVCDGYNAEGLFHINWGVFGTDNGYFQLSVLDTEVNVNEPGSNSSKNRNKDQSVICGIQPQKANSTVVPHLYFNEIVDNGTKGDSVKLYVHYITTFGNPFKGALNIGAYDMNNQLVDVLDVDAEIDITEDAVSETASWDVALDGKFKDGTYILRPVYKIGNGAYQPIRGRQTAPYKPYMRIEVKGNKVKALSSDELDHRVDVIEMTTESNSFYAGGKIDLRIVFTNKGADYYGPVCITKTENGNEYVVYENTIKIKQNENTPLNTILSLSEGKKTDSLTVWVADKVNNFMFGFDYPGTPLASFILDLKEPTPGTPKLEMLDYKIRPEVITGESEYVTVHFTLTNKGGTYNDLLRFDTYSATKGGRAYIQTPKLVSIDKDEIAEVSIKVPVKHLSDDIYGVFPISFIERHSVEVNPTGTWFCFYKYTDVLPIWISPKRMCSAFTPFHAITVPEGVQCGVVTGIKDNELVIDYRYQPGSIVPAYTPVIAISATSGYHNAPLAESKQLPPADNLLSNNRDYLYHPDYGKEGYAYYLYDINKNGFFYTANPGPIDPTDCYLVLPESQDNAESYLLHTLTAIKDVTLDTAIDDNAPVYTPAGIRINSKVSELPKGLYIIGGKKVIIP